MKNNTVQKGVGANGRKRMAFALGDHSAIGIKILEFHDELKLQDAIYDVEFKCCGVIKQLTHKRVMQRYFEEACMCNACARIYRGRTPEQVEADRKKRAEKLRNEGYPDYGVTLPTWPVPCASLIGAHIPFYDRAAADFLKSKSAT